MELDLEFVGEVGIEIERATKKFPDQEKTVSLEGWLAILVEEVGEVARELNEELLFPTVEPHLHLQRRLREELVQVAAMAERMAAAVRIQLEVK